MISIMSDSELPDFSLKKINVCQPS